YRTAGSAASNGLGDTDMGIKWNFRKAQSGSRAPALGASLYIEFPTGNVQRQLGSGLKDYWLNGIAQEPFTNRTRLTGNFGFLFAGNTSTGVIGIQTARGHVYTAGVSSALHLACWAASMKQAHASAGNSALRGTCPIFVTTAIRSRRLPIA
ncbi:MAG TPA: hypothetical protein VII58_06700, partial [Acidobacteriaceae bacterium]